MIEAMLRTGKYRFISLGGAIKHREYKPIRTEECGEDWIVIIKVFFTVTSEKCFYVQCLDL